MVLEENRKIRDDLDMTRSQLTTELDEVSNLKQTICVMDKNSEKISKKYDKTQKQLQN
jgi:hypothetical protein